MDAIVKPWPKHSAAPSQAQSDHVRAAAAPLENRPTREQAEEAVRVLIAFAGDNPAREGVLETPSRVVEAYEEMFRGYTESAADVLDKTFAEGEAYDDFVLVRDITFNSHCEHHIMPFFGKAHIAYRPVDRVVGLSKLARLVDVFARRLQTQEHMSAQIIDRHRRHPEAGGRRGDDRGRAYVHVDPRRDQARRADGDHAIPWLLPRRSERADPLHELGASAVASGTPGCLSLRSFLHPGLRFRAIPGVNFSANSAKVFPRCPICACRRLFPVIGGNFARSHHGRIQRD